MAPSSLHRHKANHLSSALVASQQADDYAHLRDVADRLRAIVNRIDKFFAACEAFLVDPDRPGHYDLAPRASDITVRYTAPDTAGGRRWASAPLSELLERAEQGLPADARVHAVHLRAADPRELFLKAARRLEFQLTLISRLANNLPASAPNQTVNVLITSPEWLATRSAILRALDPYPEARLAVAAALATEGRALAPEATPEAR